MNKQLVRISQNVLPISIPPSFQVQSLCDEVSQRYYSQLNKKPVIRLEMLTGGGELGPDDLLSDISDGQLGPVSLQAIVDRWDIVRMDERYEAICLQLKTTHLSNVVQSLSTAQNTGILSLPSGL